MQSVPDLTNLTPHQGASETRKEHRTAAGPGANTRLGARGTAVRAAPQVSKVDTRVTADQGGSREAHGLGTGGHPSQAAGR